MVVARFLHRGRKRRRAAATAVLVMVGAALTSCASAAPSGDDATPIALDASEWLYVSVGDSYAAGFQPSPYSTTEGFAQQITERSTATSTPLVLANLGCPGATSSAVVEDVGCATADSVGDPFPYPHRTQLDAAIELIRAHPGKVGLVTISAGGNDVAPCMEEADPIACAKDRAPTIERNVTKIAREIRAEVGPDVRIVGTTYPDVYVKDIDSRTPRARQVAADSLVIFRDVLNPALVAAYKKEGAGFADITSASHAYAPVDELVSTPSGTRMPAAVAAVCEYTHYCESDDVHPTTDGYSFIADRILHAIGELR